MTLNNEFGGPWAVPPSISRLAIDLIARMKEHGDEDAPKKQLIAARLCLDKRMENVWRQLLRTRGKSQYVYPARPDALNPFSLAIEFARERIAVLEHLGETDSLSEIKWLQRRIEQCQIEKKSAAERIATLSASDRQEWACKSVFFSAFSYAAAEVTVLTQADLEIVVKEIQEGTHERSAREVFSLLGVDVPQNVQDALHDFRKQAIITLFNHKDLIVARHRDDDDLRAFALKMTAATRRLFGTNLYGQVAVIANVALDRSDITLSKIRERVRESGDKSIERTR